MNDLSVVVWNVEWARPNSDRGRLIRKCIEEANPDVLCVTEGFTELLPDSGHVIESHPDYGYQIHKGRRKVMLWSRAPWSHVDRLGSEKLPSGRFIAGKTSTGVGQLQVYGVCIPWRDAHVRSGRKDRRAWEDHKLYLSGLDRILAGRNEDKRAIVVGDFNQRIPRSRTPIDVHESLIGTFNREFSICTAGVIEEVDSLAIDHVAHTPSLQFRNRWAIPRISSGGVRLSDHFGLVVVLTNTGNVG
jgi:exonuclease III